MAFCSEVAPSPDQPVVDDPPEEPNHAQPNQHETGDTDTTAIIIDRFPSGQAGAPIPGMARGPSIYESRRDANSDTEWAPFTSPCDWLFARWAKLHGPTSSSLDDLLRIPEV